MNVPDHRVVVDDDPLALDLMRATLKTIGINAACLLDGRQALRELDHHRPTRSSLDLLMPVFDGLAMLDELHQCLHRIRDER